MPKIFKIQLEFTSVDNEDPPFYQSPSHCAVVLTEELKGKGIGGFEVIKSELIKLL